MASKKRKLPATNSGNHTTKIERRERWAAASKACLAAGAVKLTGDKDARYTWVKLIKTSSLAPLTRFIALALSTHGRADGSNLFVGVRALADETGMATNSVTKHLEALVRAGYLWRQHRSQTDTWRTSFTYWLASPKSALPTADHRTPMWEEDREWIPEPSIPHDEPPRVRSVAAHATAKVAQGVARDATHTPDVSHDGVAPLATGEQSSRSEGASKGLSVANGDGVSQTAKTVSQTENGGVANDGAQVSHGMRPSPKNSGVLGSKSLKNESHTRVSASQTARAPEVDIEGKIRTLKTQGYDATAIVAMLRQYSVTLTRVQEVA